jgi:hypothetical protein
MVNLLDAETGRRMTVDTSSTEFRIGYKRMWEKRERDLAECFARSGVDSAKIRTDESYVQPLMKLFKKRGKK